MTEKREETIGKKEIRIQQQKVNQTQPRFGRTEINQTPTPHGGSQITNPYKRCKKRMACKADSSNGHGEPHDATDQKKWAGADNSSIKLHASKDGTIAAHLTQVGLV
jgi:hypothetical protein